MVKNVLNRCYAYTVRLFILFFLNVLQYKMVKQRSIAYCGLSLVDFSVVSTDYLPALKWLGSRAPGVTKILGY